MSNHSDYTDLFDSLLDGTMDGQEAAEFKARLKNDPELAKNLEQHKLVVDAVRYHGRNKLLSKVKRWDVGMDSGKSGDIHDRGKRRWIYAAAASLALLLVAGYLLFTNLDIEYKRLAANYYEPYKFMPTATRGETVKESALDEVINFFVRGEYNKVIVILIEMDESQRTDSGDFMLANAYQAMEQYEEASRIYEKIANSSSLFARPSKWYLALCYLSLEKPERAEMLLKKLKEGNNVYATKARKLLRELD